MALGRPCRLPPVAWAHQPPRTRSPWLAPRCGPSIYVLQDAQGGRRHTAAMLLTRARGTSSPMLPDGAVLLPRAGRTNEAMGGDDPLHDSSHSVAWNTHVAVGGLLTHPVAIATAHAAHGRTQTLHLLCTFAFGPAAHTWLSPVELDDCPASTRLGTFPRPCAARSGRQSATRCHSR